MAPAKAKGCYVHTGMLPLFQQSFFSLALYHCVAKFFFSLFLLWMEFRYLEITCSSFNPVKLQLPSKHNTADHFNFYILLWCNLLWHNRIYSGRCGNIAYSENHHSLTHSHFCSRLTFSQSFASKGGEQQTGSRGGGKEDGVSEL